MLLNQKNLEKAKEKSLEIINKNLKKWNNLFPDASSICGIYPVVNNFLAEGGWTAGFWTGMLWDAYLLSEDKHYQKMAEYHLSSFRHRLRENILVDHHDLGFLFIPTAVKQWIINPSKRVEKTIVWAADLLLKRFNHKGGFIQAWGRMDDVQSSRMIIDCNLNVPLLFKASEITKEKKYREVACSHLKKAVENLIRKDGSTYHTFYFDYETGIPKEGKTHQGYCDDSCWSRGQAWAVYGFALAYQQTKEKIYLDAYQKTAKYFIEHLPKDKIPYWDLDFQEGSEERDTSAAVIFINGVLELNDNLKTDINQKKFVKVASEMFDNLVENYLNKSEDKEGLILESVYNKPAGTGINECTIWGDFYFLQIVTRELENKKWVNPWL